MGCISSREDDGFCVVEITFHDTSRNRKRIPLLNDFYHFSMASLGAQVCGIAHLHIPAPLFNVLDPSRCAVFVADVFDCMAVTGCAVCQHIQRGCSFDGDV